MPRLFTPFDRLGAEQTGVEGTGLGLALRSAWPKRWTATIGVETEPAREHVLDRAAERREPAVAARAEIARRDRRSTQACHAAAHAQILYVEDNLSNLTLVQRILAHGTTTSS